MFTSLLKRLLPWKDLGWHDFGETFYRFTLFKSKWFSVYLHCLIAPHFLPSSHDHPWDFTTIILLGGYWEQLNCEGVHFRPAPSILFRPAETRHNIKTSGTAWSLVFCRPKRRGWGFGHCRNAASGNPSNDLVGVAAVDEGSPAGSSLRLRRTRRIEIGIKAA